MMMIWIDAEEIPGRLDSYDAVIMIALIEHLVSKSIR